MKPIYIGIFTLFSFTSAIASDEFTDEELNPVEIAFFNNYRYELSYLLCAKEERYQRADTTENGQKRARWLTETAKYHPNSFSYTRYVGGAYDGGGCYEKTERGLRIYHEFAQPTEIATIVVPCRANLTQTSHCARSAANLPSNVPAAPSVPDNLKIFRPTPNPDSSQKILGTLSNLPYGRSAEYFFFEEQRAILWTVSCKIAAQIQMSEMDGADFDFFNWQSKQIGNLLMVERVDGAWSQSCYDRAPNGIVVHSYQNNEPFLMKWK